VSGGGKGLGVKSALIYLARISKLIFGLFILSLFFPAPSPANPYLAKPGETPIRLRIATCAVSGGFVHLYTAMDNGLFNKYGLIFEHIYIQASAPSLAALAADEIQFLYCAADATIPTLAAVSAANSLPRCW
jgi:ABC-type nitrate/sulfonate/bicarbonate transport system substrate-binding protein